MKIHNPFVLLLIIGSLCLGVLSQTKYQNPVLAMDFPDPCILKTNDSQYFVYATQGNNVNIQVASSSNLVNWTYLGEALPVKPTWANETQNFWAPDVQFHSGLYYMYYAAQINGDSGDMCIGLATSQVPQGPFTDQGHYLMCADGFQDIDPKEIDDPATGNHILYWGSDFQPLNYTWLSNDRTRIVEPFTQVNALFPNASSPYESLIEGSWVWPASNGYYYLFYSGNACCGEGAHYAVSVARSVHGLYGPWEKMGNVLGRDNSIVLQLNDYFNAPGHNSIITDNAGQDWMFYHAINDAHAYDGNVRMLMMDPIDYNGNGEGWPIVNDGTPSYTVMVGPVV